ncbi:hypothetical protein T439DRAFT_324494 [Meredithblackwellia eburnea MCA 4105]
MPSIQQAYNYGTPQAASLADEYSYATVDRSFKNQDYRKNLNRRNKTLKQILATERERVDKLAKDKREQEEAAKAAALESGTETAPMQVDGASSSKAASTAFADMVTYSSVEAPPSLQPAKKYCDVTGLEAPYVDPRSTLRYHNAEIYEVLKTFQPAVIQSYLAVRGSGVVLR